jgi:hypothetical protein
MLKFGLVAPLLLLLTLAPFSTGTTHISLTKESSLAQEPFTPLVPDSGLEIAASALSEDALDANIADIPFVIIPPAQQKQAVQKKVLIGPDSPVSISFPTLGTFNKVEKVGVNAQNEMEVPSGDTTDVGWYDGGTIPGENGSAVIDAHVFAAFKKLRYLKVGQGFAVTMASGKVLHFTVTDSRVYTLSEVPLDLLFNRDDGKYLNLITCAGKLTPDHKTYDHRLIVFAKLVQ